ncbi:hypothetical protein BEN30_05015 [Magnetovibrio blakemorei]|uniref:Uncharacterized protein n=1 Tax=Magnetovibrio blakemorei TaxID=28181 RepID=A0A1E5QAY2_9PROT|nr:hypothetical protein BEN30_05015 [Magnetovibrio blakemorei]
MMLWKQFAARLISEMRGGPAVFGPASVVKTELSFQSPAEKKQRPTDVQSSASIKHKPLD